MTHFPDVLRTHYVKHRGFFVFRGHCKVGVILQEKLSKLEKFFHFNPEVAIAFSSGVDSSFLLHAACKYAEIPETH